MGSLKTKTSGVEKGCHVTNKTVKRVVKLANSFSPKDWGSRGSVWLVTGYFGFEKCGGCDTDVCYNKVLYAVITLELAVIVILPPV